MAIASIQQDPNKYIGEQIESRPTIVDSNKLTALRATIAASKSFGIVYSMSARFWINLVTDRTGMSALPADRKPTHDCRLEYISICDE